MILYGLRLLVALLTFAVGAAAAWLFNPVSLKNPEAGVAVSKSGDATTVSRGCSRGVR